LLTGLFKAMPAGYKPSPLGYGSQRGSPFRRPESPASSSPLRQTTPTTSPSKIRQGSVDSRFTNSAESTPTTETWTARGNLDGPQSPSSPRGSRSSVPKIPINGNALSQLQPAQVRNLRDGFQILDRDSDGVVNREDVADMLNQLGKEHAAPYVRVYGLTRYLGLPSAPSDVSQFFPPSAQQTMTLAVFLNTISSSLAALSPSSELLSAFSAFDDDDSGQIDLAELRDAILHTAPEPGERAMTAAEVDKVINGFTGRRAFSKSRSGGLGKKGEIFRYHDFVNSVVGGNGSSEQGSSDNAADE
jgi:Ca2+-binding EF-hand superfamily protein